MKIFIVWNLSHDYGGCEVPESTVSKLEIQESQWQKVQFESRKSSQLLDLLFYSKVFS